MLKICLFGGTFNPIHNGHIGMCLEVLKHYKFDKFFVIPAGDSYFKTDVLSKEHRVNMVKLSIEGIDELEYSDVEVMREGHSYSIDTINYYKDMYDNADIYFVIGEDTAYSITKWYKADEILSKVKLIVLNRNNNSEEATVLLNEQVSMLKKEYNAHIDVLEYSYSISSSEIRNMVKTGDFGFKKHLMPKVADYIIDNSLYR